MLDKSTVYVILSADPLDEYLADKFGETAHKREISMTVRHFIFGVCAAVGGLVLVGGVGLVGYDLYNSHTTDSAKVQARTEITKLETDMKSLKQQLETATATTAPAQSTSQPTAPAPQTAAPAQPSQAAPAQLAPQTMQVASGNDKEVDVPDGWHITKVYGKEKADSCFTKHPGFKLVLGNRIGHAPDGHPIRLFDCVPKTDPRPTASQG
jgi:hypothetical protein